MSWETVVGLEIHVQLKTRTKMFCRCPAGFGSAENAQTCPVCLGFPGALPVPNGTAIAWTIKLGLALGCEIAPRAVFARKNYFYPDLPKGYQISQYDMPSCENGKMLVPMPEGELEVGIVRAHLEEDAAKTVHMGGHTGRIGGAEYSLVDYNRGGTPLLEIVTAPDIRSAEEAKRFLQLLRQTVVELGISDAEMEKGTLRVDANVSVRPAGSDELRTRCEIKNMNSFNYIARGIDAEAARQIAVWEAGGEVKQETFDFDAGSGALTPRRSKEEADDYRYFPEPDLVPVEPPADLIERLRRELPEPPSVRFSRYIASGMPFNAAEAVAMRPGFSQIADRMIGGGWPAAEVGSAVLNLFSNTEIDLGSVDVHELKRVYDARDRLPRDAFAAAVSSSADPGFSAEPYLAQEAVSDASALDPVIDAIIAANPGQVAAFRGGKEGLLGFFVGQVMKETGGTANPRVVSELVRARLQA
jgi:aspartyl-tRNA(Asn)/glutamyl-tRNA(Gln) amidotransferase subunit B